MSFRNTALLGGLVALLGAYLYLVERPAAELEAETKSLLTFEPDLVTQLELTTRGQTIEAEKIDGAWIITAPIPGPADPRAIDTLVRTAAEAEQKREIEATAGELSAFGLDEPDAVLQLHVGDDALPRLAIGKGTPIGFNAYARRGGDDAVLLTGGTVRAAFMKRLADLREKTVLHFSEDEVSNVTITPRDGEVVRLDRTTDGWRLTAPIESPAAQSAVRNLFNSLRALRAEEFVAPSGPEAEAKRGLVPPSLRLELTGTGPAVNLRVGDAVNLGDKELVAAVVEGNAQIYLVPTHVPASLATSAADLRDKTVLRADPEAVGELRVRHREGDAFRLSKEGTTWSIPGDDRDLDPLLTQRFVSDILSLEGDEIADEQGNLAASGLGDPDIEIEIVSVDGAVIGAVVARRADDEDTPAYYAAASGGGPVYTLRDFAFTRIAKRSADLLASNDQEPGTN